MIATALIIGAVLLVGTSLLVKFWNSITSYVKKVIDKVSDLIHTAVLGIRVFLRKTSDGFMQITKNYFKNNETKIWEERIVRRPLNANEIPREKRNRLTMDEEFDITDEYENVLTNGVAV